MRNAKSKLTMVLVLAVLALTGCVGGGYGDGDGRYSNRNYYRGGGGQPGGYYDENDSANSQRQRRVQTNCNMGWQNCVNTCNQVADANQRFACIANCNNARNICVNNN